MQSNSLRCLKGSPPRSLLWARLNQLTNIHFIHIRSLPVSRCYLNVDFPVGFSSSCFLTKPFLIICFLMHATCPASTILNPISVIFWASRKKHEASYHVSIRSMSFALACWVHAEYSFPVNLYHNPSAWFLPLMTETIFYIQTQKKWKIAVVLIFVLRSENRRR